MGCFKRTTLKHVYYLGWNRSPAQDGCMRQVLRAGAMGRHRGIGWRGRWEGGSGWGIHVTPWLIHVNVWQKPLQYCKIISLQLIKINGKKRKKRKSFIFYLYNVCIEMNNFCILKLVSSGLIYALLILIMNNENYISPFLFLCHFCLFVFCLIALTGTLSIIQTKMIIVGILALFQNSQVRIMFVVRLW